MGGERIVECVVDRICHLGEGPIWNTAAQKLYWTDIPQKRIWVYDPASSQSEIFWEDDLEVGGFAFTADGGVVLCTHRGVFMLDGPGPVSADAEARCIYDIRMKPGERFNETYRRVGLDPFKEKLYATH